MAVLCSPLPVLRREASLAREGVGAGNAGVGVLLIDRVRSRRVSRYGGGEGSCGDPRSAVVKVSVKVRAGAEIVSSGLARETWDTTFELLLGTLLSNCPISVAVWDSGKVIEVASRKGVTEVRLKSGGLCETSVGERAFDRIGFKVDGLDAWKTEPELVSARMQLMVGSSVDVVSVLEELLIAVFKTVVTSSSPDVLVGRKSLGDERVRCSMFVVAVAYLTENSLLGVSYSSTELHLLATSDAA